MFFRHFICSEKNHLNKTTLDCYLLRSGVYHQCFLGIICSEKNLLNKITLDCYLLRSGVSLQCFFRHYML